MRWQGRRQSRNIEDRRGAAGVNVKTGGSILGVLVVLVGAYYGIDLSGLVSDGGVSLGSNPSGQVVQESAEEAQLNELVRVVLADTEEAWGTFFQQNGGRYRDPVLVLYRGGTRSACGIGQTAMGPFYCSADEKIYLDLSFYDQMKHQLGAKGEFAFAYVIAHEVGHHVQHLLGTLERTHRLQQQGNEKQANRISVLTELQADCYAGVWGASMQRARLLEAGDVADAMRAAQAVGDDTLQKRAQGYAVPDSFTHGSAAQRMQWFERGLQRGNPADCNTFAQVN